MFGYFGAKHGAAKRYQPPRYDLIVEPFAGAAGYSCYWLEQGMANRGLLIEKNRRVVDAWLRILATQPQAIDVWPTPLVGEVTSDLLITALAGAGGLSDRPQKVTSQMSRDWQLFVRSRIASMRGTIGDNIEVIHGDYRDAPDVEATWFIDPPYQHQGVKYPDGSGSIDYTQLASWCRERRGQVIVCEASPADWLPFRPFYTHKSIVGSLNTELVWESDPMPTLFD